jgi:hypothetical protein
MTDQNTHEFIADVSARIVEMAMESQEGLLYITYTLAYVIDALSDVAEGEPEREFAELLLMDILKHLTYTQVRPVEPAAGNIEEAVANWRDLLGLTGEEPNEAKGDNNNG